MDKTVEAIRIVTMDYYLTKPIQGLDSCYSELQNTVIKTVRRFSTLNKITLNW